MELTVNTGKGYVAADKNRPKMRRSVCAGRCDLFAGQARQL